MPFLESVEEAQDIYEEMKASEKQNVEERIGPDLDPIMEQEIADLDDMDDEDHPDYFHIDPDQLGEDSAREPGPRRIFKAISLPDKDIQVTDFYLYNITFLNFSLLG